VYCGYHDTTAGFTTAQVTGSGPAFRNRSLITTY